MSLRYPLESNGANGADTIVFSHEKYKNNRSGGGGVAGPPPAGGGAITLYMPNSTPSPSNGQVWGSKSFEGPIGKIISDAGMAGARLVQNTDANNFKSIDDIKQLGNSIGTEAGTLLNSAMNNAGGIAKQFLTDGIAKATTYNNASQLLAMSKGQIYNPNVELLYSGTRLRDFGFSYTFVPKSEQEAESVNRIIMEFKKFSAPEETQSGMFEVPHIWNVTYMTGGKKNKNMNAFKKAALVNVSVAHNPGLDMHMTFPNGMPVVTSMTLSFQEVDIITRNDHDDSGSNVGF